MNKLLWLLAVAAGATVANLYYCQPLLAALAAQLGLRAAEAGLVPTVTQIGYATGMFLFVPLGDSVERRKLISAMTLLSALPLFAVVLARSLPSLLAAHFALGACTVVPQLAVPYAAGMVPPEARGRSLGTVMSGLLLGILLSRTVSGVLGAHFGWRAVYLGGAIAMVLLAAILRSSLPSQPPQSRISYAELLRSLPGLLKEPLVRRHAILGALAFAAFSAFWTTLAFLLEAPPYRLGSDIAGLFGLVGAAGALGAPIAGRIADKRGARAVNGLALSTVLISYVILFAARRSLWVLGLAVVLLDLGVQANHVSNQTRLLGLSVERRNRINTVYMVAYFAGGAGGSALGGAAYAAFGWPGVCALGAAFSIFALLAFLSIGTRAAAEADLNAGRAR